ncbi:hypothetical protein [Yoonia algicola]|uniref:Uncharacterized protein n=1 Tax=Yoonia algicola TaxID=3137368 RepID=A0AAN0LZX4_9RHOB
MDTDVTLSAHIADHMAKTIKDTAVDNTPCQHAMPTGLFPDDVYERLLKNIPARDAFRPMSMELFHDENGVSTRDLIELPEIGVARISKDLQSLWWAVGTAIMSQKVKSAVFEALAEDLAPVLNVTESQVNDQEVFVSTALRFETESYHMPPHFDDLPRIATMLIYLPEDDSLDGLGTSLYDYAPKWQRPFRAAHRELRRAPFLPNSGIYFSGNERKKRPGWHGFERANTATLGEAPRVSLLTTWYTGNQAMHADSPDILPVSRA